MILQKDVQAPVSSSAVVWKMKLTTERRSEMEDERSENQCAHPGCGCAASPDEKYCSPHCEAAPEEIICGCGHVGCVTGAAAERAGVAQS
jgi:hypothetical protein